MPNVAETTRARAVRWLGCRWYVTIPAGASGLAWFFFGLAEVAGMVASAQGVGVAQAISVAVVWTVSGFAGLMLFTTGVIGAVDVGAAGMRRRRSAPPN